MLVCQWTANMARYRVGEGVSSPVRAQTEVVMGSSAMAERDQRTTWAANRERMPVPAPTSITSLSLKSASLSVMAWW